MSDPTGWQGGPDRQGLPCPQCGALRAPDNTPSCACARRASDALRDARTAEAAAAEDFDPLRIRPYVEIGEDGETPPHEGAPGPAEVTMALRPVPADETVQLRAVDPAAAFRTPLAPTGAEPSTTDLSLFEPADGGPYADDEDAATPRDRRRRRVLLLATAAAVVAVATTAGLASGLFSYEQPARDDAAPRDVRAAVPDASTSAASVSAAPSSGSPSPSASSASPSASASESASPSPSASSASPSASASAEPSTTAPTAGGTPSAGPDNGADGGEDEDEGTIAAPVLRRGDHGTEVTELQLRLRQLYLFNGKANGTFNGEVENALRNYQWARGIAADGLGVYGAATRQRLESETREP